MSPLLLFVMFLVIASILGVGSIYLQLLIMSLHIPLFIKILSHLVIVYVSLLLMGVSGVLLNPSNFEES